MNPRIRNFLSSLAPVAFGTKARAEAWQLLGDLLASRMDTGRALDLAATMYRKRGRYLVAHALLDLRGAIVTGEFAAVAAGMSSPAETLLFSRYGTGDAQRMFEGAARIARSQQKISRAILSSLAQPVFLVGLMAVLFYVLGTKLFPALSEMTPERQWPPQARVVASISKVVVADHWVVLLGALALFALVRLTMNNDWPGRPILDRLPPWSLYKLRVGMAFLFALIETARMGLDVKSATLTEMARLTPKYPRVRINRIAVEMQRANIGDAAIRAGDNFPSADLNTVLSAMATQDGWVDRFAIYLDRWMENTEQAIQRIAAVLNIVLLAVVTATIGATLSAIFAILQTVQ